MLSPLSKVGWIYLPNPSGLGAPDYNLEQKCITYDKSSSVLRTPQAKSVIRIDFLSIRIVNAILNEIRDMHHNSLYGANFQCSKAKFP